MKRNAARDYDGAKAKKGAASLKEIEIGRRHSART
jgi:hypothetical protein